jgi:hypothetical protein
MTDDQRKALTEYLGEPEATSEYTVANSGDLVSVRTVIQNRTFDNDADMMALFRKMVDKKEYDRFRFVTKERLTFAMPVGMFDEQWLLYDPSRFCCLVAELWVKK